MNDFLVFFAVGLLTCIGGFLLWKRENRLFGQSVTCRGTVVGYDEYLDPTKDATRYLQPMYTLLVEYTLKDGSLMRAKEQAGSSVKKYAIGEDIGVTYSLEKPDFFVISGDKSRRIIFIGMILVGAAMVGASFLLLSR